MKSFLEWVDFINEYGEGTDLFQTVNSILANCRNDPYSWLGELSKVPVPPGDKNAERVMYELSQIAYRFLNDVRNHYLDTFVNKPMPDNSPGYQQRYLLFMQEAHRELDKLRQ